MLSRLGNFKGFKCEGVEQLLEILEACKEQGFFPQIFISKFSERESDLTPTFYVIGIKVSSFAETMKEAVNQTMEGIKL